MKPHYGTMKQIYDSLKNEDIKKECADVISVLAMTMGEGRECLKYRLLSEMEQIKEWGHEYVRYLQLIVFFGDVRWKESCALPFNN